MTIVFDDRALDLLSEDVMVTKPASASLIIGCIAGLDMEPYGTDSMFNDKFDSCGSMDCFDSTDSFSSTGSCSSFDDSFSSTYDW